MCVSHPLSRKPVSAGKKARRVHSFPCPSPPPLYPARVSAAGGRGPAHASELESSIKRLPGVLGCVVLANPDGSPAEIQAFTRAGVDRDSVQEAILSEARKARVGDGADDMSDRPVFVFELDAESHLGDRESLERAAEIAEQEARAKGPLGVLHALGTLHALAESAPESEEPGARVPLRRVLLSSSTHQTEAEVTLGDAGLEVTGSATGGRSSHGIRAVAEATLEAAAKVVAAVEFSVVDVGLETLLGREAVVVLVREREDRELLGAALVRDAPVSEAAVRATLDAINRRLVPGP